MTAIGQDIAKAASLLRKGALVAIPTETVYGLAANGLDEQAAAGIFAAKERPRFDPLILHVATKKQAKKYVSEWPDWAEKLATAFWPGPLTLLLPKKPKVPDLITSGLPRVALRVPRHSITLALLQQLDFPLAAPSANPFGYMSPTKAVHVKAQLEGKVAYILEGDAAEVGVESTIVGEENGKICVYRLGGLAVETLEEILGPVEVKPHSASDPSAPGMLKSHYAPLKPIRLGSIEKLLKEYPNEVPGVLSFSKSYNLQQGKNLVLSPEESLQEAAAHLFSYMRQLDDDPTITCILAEKVPNVGIGRAINDRLQRATVKREASNES